MHSGNGKNPSPLGGVVPLPGASRVWTMRAGRGAAQLVSARISQRSVEGQRVGAVRVFRRDVLLERPSLLDGCRSAGGERGKITELSAASLARLRLVAVNTETEWQSIATLTYPADFPGDGEAVKADVNAILTRLRERHPGLRYLWFLEFQKRGAPHLHILLGVDLGTRLARLCVRRGVAIMHNPDETDWLRRAWTRTIGHRGIVTEHAIRVTWEKINDPDGGAKYAAKYATKPEQKLVPEAFQNVGRFWASDRRTGKLLFVEHKVRVDDLEGAVNAEGRSKWGESFRVQYGDAERWRVLLAGYGGIPRQPEGLRKLQHSEHCGCRECSSWRNWARAWGAHGETLRRWDGVRFRIYDADCIEGAAT